MSQEPDRKGLEAARAVARWELGYPDWADRLIGAYLDPERALRILEANKQDATAWRRKGSADE